MHAGSERDDGPAGRPIGRVAPLAIIAAVLGWLLLSGGSWTDWPALRGPVPGTGGMIAKGHLVLLALILVIANFVVRMPREGGPIAGESGENPPEGDGASGDEAEESGSGGEKLKRDRADLG